MPSHLDSIFWSIFDRFLLPTWTPPNLKNRAPAAARVRFFKKSLFEVGWHRFLIDVGANMPPFFHQKSTNNLPKIDPKRHHFFDRFLHRFFFDFASILEANLEPCWPIFRSKHGDAELAEGGLCWVYLLFRFLGRPGPLLAPSGLDLGGFGRPFWRFLVPIFITISKFLASTFSATLALCWSIFFTKIWFLMGWWGYAKRKGFY